MKYSSTLFSRRLLLTIAACCSALILAACAPQVTDPGELEEDEVVMAFSWSADSNCVTCHAAEAASATDASCQLSAGHSSTACIECHTDTAGLSSAHAKVTATDTDGTSRLRKTEVTGEACLGCHEGDYAPEATVASTALTDSEGTVVNPHDLPEVVEHEDIVCADCHSMHAQESLAETASEKCLTCHHEDVYECGTCHS